MFDTANALDAVNLAYARSATNSLVAPKDSVNFLTSDDYDQISGILSDYCAAQMLNLQSLRAMPCASSASDVVQKWLERAADLRDRIEAR
jgi:hypothetical protein